MRRDYECSQHCTTHLFALPYPLRAPGFLQGRPILLDVVREGSIGAGTEVVVCRLQRDKAFACKP
eukprot:scaffold770_cov255-Pinguiococcus_pyrenoidosus.AAC.11